MQTTTYNKTAALTLCALFAALTGVFSWIAIPLPFTPIPVNLATLAVFLTGGLLGWKYGAISEIVYAFLGAVGAPVFSNFTSGIGVLAGPTGGYIIGYIAAALLTGLMLQIFEKKFYTPKYTASGEAQNDQHANIKAYLCPALAAVVGLLSCYALGTLWFVISTGNGIYSSLLLCVVPFLPGDILKIIAASILIKKLRPLVHFRFN